MNKQKSVMVAVVAVLLLVGATSVVAGTVESDLGKLRAATAQFHRPEVAMAQGWDLVPGLDYCFQNPGVGAMGYHYINVDKLDTTVEMLEPEAMVYPPGPNGQLQLGAVEYVVPAAAWDAEGHGELPSLFGQHFHLNEPLGVYVLHVWIWKHNEAGIFEDWNPDVTCP